MAAPGAKPVDEELAAAKKALDLQMNAPVYNTCSPVYIGREWQGCEVVHSIAFGKDQKFSGLARHGVPHGWGILEHHLGLTQTCSHWCEGVANGPGTLQTDETLHYGTWALGVRIGYFALVKEGAMYIEQYGEDGKLLRRIKWRRDKIHTPCTRCGKMFVPAANSEHAPLCRYHPDPADFKGTYPCCGAMQVYTPLGCSLTVHCAKE
eukprot:TRINITY_DN2780_c0_g1_i1.p1 TRINITY_DN2780_c0_g1~~TRINITY_DN2780_c0_g1_i1.p1  ORF type:complete len:207 (+),score=52.36 TRINITY_DN2780_c0_g1_i1:48-668(+)